jgi:hypothetical protein
VKVRAKPSYPLKHSTLETVRLTAGKARLRLFRGKDLPRNSLAEQFTHFICELLYPGGPVRKNLYIFSRKNQEFF